MGEVFRRLHPLFREAFSDLGYPDREFGEVLGRAVDKLLAVPVVTGDIELVEKVLVYAYADEKLGGLTKAQKHLLRMGPENVRRVQVKLKELRSALVK